MSVLITPLPNDDAIIMTESLTCYLRDIVYISIDDKEGVSITLTSNTDKKYIKIKSTYDMIHKLLELGLTYGNANENIIFPKISISYVYRENAKNVCVLFKRFTVYISSKLFIKIQEDIMLKHVQTIEREELERENKMMRAHIEFSPGGQEFFKVMESFKNKQKNSSF